MKKAKKAKAKKTAKKMRPAKAAKTAKKATTVRAKKAVPKKARVGRTQALAGGEPDHRCKRTLEPGICIKFWFNAKNGQFDQPLEGERVPCSECQHFF